MKSEKLRWFKIYNVENIDYSSRYTCISFFLKKNPDA